MKAELFRSQYCLKVCGVKSSLNHSYLISLILAPPFPIIQPIKSFGILISVVAVAVVAKAALAAPGWPKLLAAAKVAKAIVITSLIIN